MRIDVVAKPPEQVKGDAIIAAYPLPIRKGRLPLAKYLRTGVARMLLAENGALSWWDGTGSVAPRILLACVGAAADQAPSHGCSGGIADEDRRQHAARSARVLGARTEEACHEQGIERLVVAPLPEWIDPAAFVEALILRGYANDEFRADPESTSLRRVTLCVPAESVAEMRRRVDEAKVLADAVNVARSLADLPANVGTPRQIVARVRRLATEVGLVTQSWGPAQIAKQGMGLVAAVMRGAEEPGRLLTLEHRPPGYRDLPTLVFIGKGVVHDTGGYNLKRDETMHRFTDDKSGAAAMIGAMRAIGALALPLHVVGIAALVENLIDGAAFKPGDILTAMDGTTVFIENTDAEGRLVLADCLTLAERYKPRLVVDLATLTGAAWAALGPACAALFTNDDHARDLLVAAGHRSGDLLWPMPIHPVHDAHLGHRLADLRNVGPREGGACVAAAFLRRFVDYPWAHVDMGGHGSSAVEREFMGPGATGFGTRLLVSVAQLAAAQWGAEA